VRSKRKQSIERGTLNGKHAAILRRDSWQLVEGRKNEEESKVFHSDDATDPLMFASSVQTGCGATIRKKWEHWGTGKAQRGELRARVQGSRHVGTKTIGGLEGNKSEGGSLLSRANSFPGTHY